ncbi:MAG: DEAD/DEAH box helicase family protein [Candidatus Pacebacteria bacterium]|nr:DEAD/DEAH box helicase family protein [Candidatus Paceibacterota bacterium]
MVDIVVHQKDDVYLNIECEAGIAHDISDFFTFRVPGYKFMPAYRSRAWDGKIRLFNAFGGELYVGLLPYVEEFAERRNLTIQSIPLVATVNVEDTERFFKQLDPYVNGESITPYGYQVNAVHHAINHKRALMISPTSSGKSLMIYALVNHYLNITSKKVLIIVPTTSLVEQLYKDFEDYSTGSKYNYSSDMTHIIYAGKDKVTDKRVVITTWQSIYKLKKDWFKSFGAVIGDEAHNFKAKSLTSILTKMTECEYKFGFTGTLDGTQTHKLVLEGLFGQVHRITTSRDLMDSETIAKLHIEAVTLGYTDEEKKLVKQMIYKDEIDFLINHKKRNKFICDLALSRETNTLLLYQYVQKHGTKLFDYLVGKAPDRPIFFVSGDIKTEVREEIRAITETSTNAIIVASYGTFSTGINIRNLHNIIFGHPVKSRIRNLQSVGRGLRKFEGKSKATLFDLSDDLSWKKHKNYSLKHFFERVKIYNSEKFDYKLRSIKL